MYCSCNVKGNVVAYNKETKTIQARGENGILYENIIPLNTLGTNSIVNITKNTNILILKSLGSNSVLYGIVFNILQQNESLPVVESSDYAIGSILGKNSITFQASGNTIESATNKTLNVESNTINANNNIVNADTLKNKSSAGGEVNVDALIEIKNSATTLKIIIEAILNACQTITVNVNGVPTPIDNIPAFASITALNNSLLK